jgi:hypothetical protein
VKYGHIEVIKWFDSLPVSELNRILHKEKGLLVWAQCLVRAAASIPRIDVLEYVREKHNTHPEIGHYSHCEKIGPLITWLSKYSILHSCVFFLTYF